MSKKKVPLTSYFRVPRVAARTLLRARRARFLYSQSAATMQTICSNTRYVSPLITSYYIVSYITLCYITYYRSTYS